MRDTAKDLIHAIVDISGNYENVGLEISVSQSPRTPPLGEFVSHLYHRHPYYEFFFVQEESVTLHTEDGEPILLSKGDICIVPPFCQHYTELSPTLKGNVPAVLFIAAFSFYENHLHTGRDLFKALSAFLNKSPSPMVTRAQAYASSEGFAVLSDFSAALTRSDTRAAFLDFCKLIELLLENSAKERTFFSKSDIIRKIDYFISCCYMYDIKLTHLAEHFYISEHSLNRLVLEYYHETFHSLLTKQRMTIAKTYLKNTDLPVSRIAEIVGYSSLNSFYAAFKKHVGILPTDYRRQDG